MVPSFIPDNKHGILDFPTPRERAGVSLQEDLDMLLDSLLNAALALKHSENVIEDDRESELRVLIDLFAKYVTLKEKKYEE